MTGRGKKILVRTLGVVMGESRRALKITQRRRVTEREKRILVPTLGVVLGGWDKDSI